MKPIIGRFILIFSFLISFLISKSQDSKPIPVFTADSLATGNYKDVLTSFFQLAFDNLVGPQKDFKFTSNPYAIMMRANPNLAVDTSYLRYTALRNLNFAFSVRLDSSFKFNGFTAGVNYAIINKRDYTVYREFLRIVKTNTEEYAKMNNGVTGKVIQLRSSGDTVLYKKVQEQWLELRNRDGELTFSSLDEEVRLIFLDIATARNLPELKKMLEEKQNVSVFQKTDEQYRAAKDIFKNRLLWTAGITDTTYNDQYFFSNIALNTQLLKGFANPKSPNGFELDIKATYNFMDDIVKPGQDLKRSMLNAEAGINYVRRSKRTDLSFFELKLSAAYLNIFTGAYIEEVKEVFTLNGILRVRIIDDIWLPVKFQYDPKNGNLFGFLSVKANFTALKNVIAPRPPS